MRVAASIASSCRPSSVRLIVRPAQASSCAGFSARVRSYSSMARSQSATACCSEAPRNVAAGELRQPLQRFGHKGVRIACAALGNRRHGNLARGRTTFRRIRDVGAKRLERRAMRHTAGRDAVTKDRRRRVSFLRSRRGSARTRLVRAFERGRQILRDRTGERPLPNPLRLFLRALRRHAVRLAKGGELAARPAVSLVRQRLEPQRGSGRPGSWRAARARARPRPARRRGRDRAPAPVRASRSSSSTSNRRRTTVGHDRPVGQTAVTLASVEQAVVAALSATRASASSSVVVSGRSTGGRPDAQPDSTLTGQDPERPMSEAHALTVLHPDEHDAHGDERDREGDPRQRSKRGPTAES